MSFLSKINMFLYLTEKSHAHIELNKTSPLEATLAGTSWCQHTSSPYWAFVLTMMLFNYATELSRARKSVKTSASFPCILYNKTEHSSRFLHVYSKTQHLI